MFTQHSIIGVIGCGAMGSGIAQVAATSGHRVLVYDNNLNALTKAGSSLQISLQKLVEKQKISVEKQSAILANIRFTSNFDDLKECHLVIEAIVENIDVKKSVFAGLEKMVSDTCV